MSSEANERDRAGRIELHYAAASNGTELEKVRRWVAEGADIEARDYEGHTPLLAAAHYPKSADIIRFLMASGANVHAVDNAGHSALKLALWRGKSLELARLFLEAGCDPHQKAKDGRSPADFVNDYGTDEERALFASYT